MKEDKIKKIAATLFEHFSYCWNWEVCNKMAAEIVEGTIKEVDKIMEKLDLMLEDKPTIEVGDVAQTSSGFVFTVVGFINDTPCWVSNSGQICSDSSAKLIRKGPKQHVFEGVTISEYHPFPFSGAKLKLDNGETGGISYPNGLISEGKTYRMTLTEMEKPDMERGWHDA